MHSIWSSLAWKEWQEHKWKVASIVAVIIGLVVCMLAMRWDGSLAETLQVSLYVCGVPFAIFAGLGIAAGEQSQGTIRFLQALPVPMWRVAICKLVIALVSLFVALLTIALFYVVARVVLSFVDVGINVALPRQTIKGEPFPGHNWAPVTICLVILMGMSLVTWAAACGVNRRDEVSAGAMALGAMLAWWIILFLIWTVLLRQSEAPDTARVRAMGLGSAPVGFLFINEAAKGDVSSIWFGWIAFAVMHCALVARFVLKFGHVEDHGVRSPRSVARSRGIPNFLAPPRRFALTAIAWKQLRESGPIALAGLIAIAAIAACFCLTAWYINDGLSNIPIVLGQTATVFGFFVALVAGIGVALHDVGTDLHTFWRSRPIQPDLWFFVKFLTGLTVVLAVIYAPIGLFVATGGQFDYVMTQSQAMMVTAAQVAVYAAAVLVTCVVRQAVYSAILSIAVVYLGVFASHWVWKAARYFDITGWGADSFWNQTEMQFMVGLIGTSVVCMIAAWLAMRNDWGRGRW